MPCRTHRIFKTCGPFRASCRIQCYLTTVSVKANIKVINSHCEKLFLTYRDHEIEKYINDLCRSSDKLSFYSFAHVTNLLYADRDTNSLERVVNAELSKVQE